MVRPGISAVRDVNECNLLCKNPDPTGLESEAILLIQDSEEVKE